MALRQNADVLVVRVTPKSSRNAVVVEGDAVKIYVTAPPADGEANAAVIAVLAKALGIAKSKLAIVRGESSREKTISVEGLSAEEALRRLNGI